MKAFKFELLAKLEDGTPVVFNGDFVIGTEVFVLDEQGQKLPAPDGEHKLEDGTVFSVKEGKIENIPVEVPAEDVPAEQEMKSEVNEFEKFQSQVNDVTKSVQELFQIVKEVKDELNSMKEQRTAFESSVNEKFSAVGNVSVTEKEPETKVEKSFEEIVFERINQLKK